MTRDLHAEVSAFLAEHGASTSKQIAAGVRARRADVDEALLAGVFVEAPPPEGGSHRARYWVDPAISSGSVLPRLGGKGRAAAMLEVLSDGRPHSRAEIFKAAGRFFLTNNAASQLRAQGYDIRVEQASKGVYVYRLAGRPSLSVLRTKQPPSRKARSVRVAA